MDDRAMSLKRKLLLLTVLVLLGAGATAVDLLYLFPERANPKSGETKRIVVEKGIGPRGLATLLFDSGLTNSPGRFELWLRLKKKMTSVKAGEFEIRDDLTPREIISVLSGRTTHKGTKVLIPEGFTLSQVGETLEAAGVVDKTPFLLAATNPSVASQMGILGATFEGYLFPDTYFFEKSADAELVLRTLVGNFKRHIAGLGIEKQDRRLHDIVTLASIVQSETRHADEMPIVAGVYYNRLDAARHPSMRLQADPTVAYGCEPYVRPRAPSCETFGGVLGRRQLDDPENPYNTYRHAGLPPGPISAPGTAALRAAANPRKVPFFYFVASSRGDGRHVFSATLDAHNEAVREWRQLTNPESE
jgi:UPF0755 protein